MVTGRAVRIRRSGGDRIFDMVNVTSMALFLLVMLYPLYFTVIVSFSEATQVGLGNVFLYPKGFTTEAYRHVFTNSQIWVGYKNSVVYTLFGSLYSLALMLPVAYVMSKKKLFARSFWSWLFIITMYFSGGMVPGYLLIKNLGLLNNPLVMVIGGISAYNMIVTRTYFASSIPEELYESVYIDGANEFTTFFRIALPLAKPIIAVMALYAAVGTWNSYFGAMIYLTKPEYAPLQLVLRNILIAGQQMKMDDEAFRRMSMEEQELLMRRARMAETMKYAVVFIASAPMLILYPFLQKYFIKGIMVGSLKG